MTTLQESRPPQLPHLWRLHGIWRCMDGVWMEPTNRWQEPPLIPWLHPRKGLILCPWRSSLGLGRSPTEAYEKWLSMTELRHR